MPSNIEIKARCRDLKKARAMAARLAKRPARILRQKDVFFSCARGRLKLRILSRRRGELIYYERPNAKTPKPSYYEIFRTTDPVKLRQVLAAAWGERVVVRKTRTVFLVGQTRVHLDEVEGLGSFIELEVVLRPKQKPSEGRRIARVLMRRLNISASDLVPCAYADLLRRKRGKWPK